VFPPGAGQDRAVQAAKVAFISGFNEIVLIGAVIAIVGAALGFFLVRSRDFVQQAAPEQGERSEAAAPGVA